MENKFFVNQSYTWEKKVTDSDIQEFAHVSGDYNPIHVDEEFAKNSLFGKQIAHGMLSAAYISAVLGTEFPGSGTIYLGQSLKFLKPVYLGDVIRIAVTIKELKEKERAVLQTNVTNQNGELVLEGEATVKLPKM